MKMREKSCRAEWHSAKKNKKFGVKNPAPSNQKQYRKMKSEEEKRSRRQKGPVLVYFANGRTEET